MKYTFLLPAYKSTFLDTMLRSIQNQTFEDFEVLISDDCSPEPIQEICEPYLKDSRFKYRRNKENMGGKDLVAHWNLLVDMCESEYLIMASDDDLFEPTFLEEIDKLAQKYQEVDLLRARVSRIDEEGDLLAYDSLKEEKQNCVEFLFDTCCSNHIHCIANYVFKTCRLKSVNGFVSFPLAWFTDDATVYLCSNNGVANTKQVLFDFRISTLQISRENANRKISEKKIEATMSFYDFFNKWIGTINHPKDKFHNYLVYMSKVGMRERVLCQFKDNRSCIGFSVKKKLIFWLFENQIFEGSLKKLAYSLFILLS